MINRREATRRARSRVNTKILDFCTADSLFLKSANDDVSPGERLDADDARSTRIVSSRRRARARAIIANRELEARLKTSKEARNEESSLFLHLFVEATKFLPSLR